MRKAVKAINRQKKLAFRIENGVGITSGSAIAASLGKTCARKDFTIIGNLPQQAEKLEALSKSGKLSKVIIDLPTKKLVQDFLPVEPLINDEQIVAFELNHENRL
jgi:class 3 adenylate cyclase